jgi:hypothetical protein
MDKKYICYCGNYCENCAVKAKVTPAADLLYKEMKIAGFEDFIHRIPDGTVFWQFLQSMAQEGICISCKDGGGDPTCAVKICAKEKGVEQCALADCYPCDKFDPFFECFPILQQDNDLLREQGMVAWAKLQDKRKERGFTYQTEPGT